MTPTNAFAVPQPLFASRRQRTATCDNQNTAFFTADDYAAFSVRGDVYKSRFYGSLETRRQTILTPVNASKANSKHSATIDKKHRQSKHMVQLLIEVIEQHQIQAPENIVELEDARRRLSNLSIAQHERYLMLQHQLYQALKQGLPEVLALSDKEAKQWQNLKAEVEQEQICFCRMMARGLEAELAVVEKQVTTRTSTWYDAWLAQCWNDVNRLYPRWFEPCMVVRVASCAHENTKVADLTAKEVATRGTCCVIDLNTYAVHQPVINIEKETEEDLIHVVAPRQAISADIQAEELMEQYDCDLAISSSTLMTLFDSDTPARFGYVPDKWGILMKSRASIHENGKATKRRVFLDRPLPGNTNSTREKVIEAGRADLLSRFETESLVKGSTGGRTSYHVWQLNGMRILVRSTTYANMTNSTLSELDKTKETIAPLSVFVKPDYQLLGIEEQLTTSERCRFWLHSWLRGSPVVLVARVNPRNDTITSWNTYTPTSLLYGDSAQRLLPPETFDPSLKFQWLSTIFTTLVDLPVGTYLLRPFDLKNSYTFGKKRGGVEVLMATTERGLDQTIVDLYDSMPTSAPSVQSSFDMVSSKIPVLPSWNLSDRVPYTFQTGMYCLSFFLNGICSSVAAGKSCDRAHLRLPTQTSSSSRIAAKSKRWRFENVKKVSEYATYTNIEVRDRFVTTNFRFCGEDKAPPIISDVSEVYAPVHCIKQARECSQPHLTLHQILNRLADDLLHKEREKRRVQKNGYRQRQKKIKNVSTD